MDTAGTDIKLNTGDLGYTITGDLALIDGIDNVWQSITLRLTTILGTNLFAQNYGTKLGQYVDEPITDNLLSKMKTEIKNTILADKRVKTVSNLQVIQDKGLILSFTITTINGISKSGTVKVGG